MCLLLDGRSGNHVSRYLQIRYFIVQCATLRKIVGGGNIYRNSKYCLCQQNFIQSGNKKPAGLARYGFVLSEWRDQLPAMVILPIKMEPVFLVPRTRVSAPTATMSRSMSFILPAMVISSTG